MWPDVMRCCSAHLEDASMDFVQQAIANAILVGADPIASQGLCIIRLVQIFQTMFLQFLSRTLAQRQVQFQCTLVHCHYSMPLIQHYFQQRHQDQHQDQHHFLDLRLVQPLDRQHWLRLILHRCHTQCLRRCPHRIQALRLGHLHFRHQHQAHFRHHRQDHSQVPPQVQRFSRRLLAHRRRHRRLHHDDSASQTQDPARCQRKTNAGRMRRTHSQCRST
mmetsp:Transcript_49183/g.77756  ORF Transcript_49183/g.77756 Transcript_49183/m.77756 type:complete len:219 (+) Transcript_49183:412-1068(+)